MSKKIVLTEDQLKMVLSSVIKEEEDFEPTAKQEVLTMLKAMGRDLQRANSGNFAHMAANLRGGVNYLIEIVNDNLMDIPQKGM